MSFGILFTSLIMIISRSIYIAGNDIISFFLWLNNIQPLYTHTPHIFFIHSSVNGHLSFPSGSVVKNLPAVQESWETQVRFLGREDPLEEKLATHSNILARKIPWTGEPGSIQSVRLQSTGRN